MHQQPLANYKPTIQKKDFITAMKPIFVTVNNILEIMVVPDSEVHLDGHPIITYSYNLYLMSRNASNDKCNLEDQAELARPSKTNYMGVIFSNATGVYTYDTNGPLELSEKELNEVIQKIDDYRNSPSLWHLN